VPERAHLIPVGDAERTAEGSPRQLDALQAQLRAVEERNRQLVRINDVLMNRVERAIDEQGGSFSLFQAAIALESQVRERTTALKDALGRLEETNRELQASNTAALEASRAKSAFLAAMSHELRTPMNGVVGMTELLLTTALDATQRQSTEVIQRSALSLLHILNDILDFSKIEAGQMAVERTPFNARQVVDEALQLLRPQAEQKGLTLHVGWSSDLPTDVVGDPVRFAQIVTNLVGNAIKFTPTGRVSVRAQRCERPDMPERFHFAVEDTGIGIDAAVLPRLFESFLQADSSTTRQYGGTGLGLAIVRRLCDLMGGECGATSTLGSGSRFWFAIPFGEADSRADHASSFTQAQPAMLEGPTTGTQAIVRAEGTVMRARRQVLIVEDNEVNQLVAEGYLTALGFQCTVVPNGRIAAELLCAPHEFELVLMDWQMPELDGLEATRLVRQHERATGAHVVIVGVTANALVGDRERCLDSGMDEFLSKPFQLRELRAVLDRWPALAHIATAGAPSA
jgi:signal transduction histidine kinase